MAIDRSFQTREGISVNDVAVIDAAGAWVGPGTNITGFQGQTGAQGAAGQVGSQGSAGVQGTAGAQGRQGVVGAQGAVGAQGRQGAVGPAGVAGTAGAQGAAGAQGRQGAVGAQGAQGSQGIAGVQGAQGTAGAQGRQGVQGPAGPSGVSGVAGPPGAQGSQGPQGLIGFAGPPGPQGAAGSTQTSATNATTPSLRVGTGPSTPPSGQLWVANNITAYYSDIRLKQNITVIDDCLSRVQQISGIYYTQNQLAEKYGFLSGERQIGLIAQQVQPSIPQAVAPAPFDIASDESSVSGQNYLTIRYEKIIPVLVQAIKEQQQQLALIDQQLQGGNNDSR